MCTHTNIFLFKLYLTWFYLDLDPGTMSHDAQANICAIMIDQDQTRVMYNSEARLKLENYENMFGVTFTLTCFFLMHKWQWSALLSKKSWFFWFNRRKSGSQSVTTHHHITLMILTILQNAPVQLHAHVSMSVCCSRCAKL